MQKNIYTITINKFFEHNPKAKKSYTHFMLSKRIFSDEKVSQLKPIELQLYLYCLAICADMASERIQISAQMLPKYFRISTQMLSNCLSRLEELQLLTAEKNHSLVNRIEEKRIEEKRIEVPARSKVPKKPDHAEKELNKKIWESFSNAYRLRYGVEPVRNATINTQISALRKRLGIEACDVVLFYLSHNDSFYLKATHSLGLCLRDCESLRTQMLRGTAITSTMVKSFENQNKFNETMSQIDKMWGDDVD